MSKKRKREEEIIELGRKEKKRIKIEPLDYEIDTVIKKKKKKKDNKKEYVQEISEDREEKEEVEEERKQKRKKKKKDRKKKYVQEGIKEERQEEEVEEEREQKERKRKKKRKKEREIREDEERKEESENESQQEEDIQQTEYSKKKKKKKKRKEREIREEEREEVEEKEEEIAEETEEGFTQEIEDTEQTNHSKKKKKKKKRKEREEREERNDLEQTVPPLTEDISEEEEILNYSKDSRHWIKRQKLIKELQEWSEDDEDEEAHRVAMETFGQDMYANLHEAFATTVADKQKLKETCGSWRTGNWTVKEFQLLKRNLKLYMKSTNIKDVSDLIHSTEKNINFYRTIARDINRPLFLVYRKIVSLFDEENYVGRWTEEMDKELLDLYSLHGNKWALIGRSLGVSGGSCISRYRIIKGKKNNKKGPWSEDEKARLHEAMKEYCGHDVICEDTLVPQLATWELIAERVGTRHFLQCRSMWVMMLAWKLKGLGEEKWTPADDLKLIETLGADSDLEDIEDVNWEELAKDWPSARSRYYLRTKWNCLKQTVPYERRHLFRDTLLYLVRQRAPIIRREIKRNQED